MITSDFFPDFNLRRLMTVNSENDVAFAADDTDIETVVAADGLTAQQIVNARFTDDTDEDSIGRIIDLGVLRNSPLEPIQGTVASGALRLAPEVASTDGYGVMVPKRLMLYPVGVGDEDDTYTVQVFEVVRRGLSYTGKPNEVFSFKPMIQFEVVLGAYPTDSGTTSEVFAKTITVADDSDNAWFQLDNVGADGSEPWVGYPMNAGIIISTMSARYLYIRMTLEGAADPATSMNLEWGIV